MIKPIIGLLICVLFSTNVLLAKEIKYAAAEIPDSLKKNAFAVIRNSETVFEIVSLTKTRTLIKEVVTVLNENGKSMGYKYLHYDNNRKIVSVEGNIYNGKGVHVDKITKKDFRDVSMDPYGTMYSDTRILISKYSLPTFPYTIEYVVEYEFDYSFFFPDWEPVERANLSIENSSFKVIYPPEYKFRYAEYNLDGLCDKKIENFAVTWTLKNFKAFKKEPFMPGYEHILPMVVTSPSTFEYDNYSGNLNSWKNFGMFLSKLNEGRDFLPQEEHQIIQAITDSCENEYDKVKNLYKYMQSKTRYVSIQVGIGGFQPIPAETVSKTGYGDCKALSNYMKAILNVAGIKSYYTLIKAGKFAYAYDTKFVHNPYNHIILFVPLDNDTLWLECTSQTLPCGFLGDFTDNRYGMVVREMGGELIKTPEYSLDDNKIVRFASVSLDNYGSGIANTISWYGGLEYDEMHGISVDDKESQKKKLYQLVDIKSFKIESFSLETIEDEEPILIEKLKLKLPNYASITGSRMFVPVNLMSRSNFVPKDVSDRKFEISKKYTGTYIDTIVYHIPENYKIESLPKEKIIENKYGNYKIETLVESEEIKFVRYFQIFKGLYPANEYKAFIQFFKDVNKNDNTFLILHKKE